MVIDKDAAPHESTWGEERVVLEPGGSQMRSDWQTYIFAKIAAALHLQN